jgi:hypothetical protein
VRGLVWESTGVDLHFRFGFKGGILGFEARPTISARKQVQIDK